VHFAPSTAHFVEFSVVAPHHHGQSAASFPPKDERRRMDGKTSMMGVAGLILAYGALAGLAGMAVGADQPAAQDRDIARGKYVIEIAGCNDCHTPGFAPSGGQTPESQWLVGDALGWQGPWGTTYAANLRHYFRDRTEAEWVRDARTLATRPPMPWFNVRRMSDQDLRAVYRYVRSLPVAGSAAPAYVPPGQQVQGPVIVFPTPPGPEGAPARLTRR
jgi:mono/diheme cytochrome c family protein